MIKKILIFASFLLLANCTTPTSAFLGPIFTGAKTGSIYQASLSYGSNRIINKFKASDNNQSSKSYTVNYSDISTFTRKSEILNSYEISEVKISEVIEEEPLP